MDTKTRRGPEIGSDHYAVVTKIKENGNTENYEIRKQMKEQFENIKSYKLRRKEIAKKYEKVLNEKIQRTSGTVNYTNIEELWNDFKMNIINAAKEVCGVNKRNNAKKQTAWWTEDIKKEVEIKKKAWKNYLSNKTTDNYEKYKSKEN